MPAGAAGRGRKKPQHKGCSRHFTSEADILRQQEEIRKQKEVEDDDSTDDGLTAKDKATNATKSRVDEEEESSSDEEMPTKGVQGLIEISNPNRVKQKNKKLKDLHFDTPTSAGEALNRKERDAIEMERKKAEYQKRHARGETDEAQKDMARLAIIRKEREEAAMKREQEKKVKK